jgi:uncharacterized caspase-like protein
MRRLSSYFFTLVFSLISFHGLAAITAGAGDAVPAINRLPRVALVIGNSQYATSPLKNARHDATAIAERLKRMGFDVVVKLDASKKDMDEAISGFGTKLREHNGIGLFYFAGHGAQLNWRNYLIPVDASIADVRDLQKRAVDLTTILDSLSFARNPVNLVILDACRDNPFGATVALEQKGLSQVDAPPGTLLAYATAPGNVAADGSGANGLYTHHLLKEMQAADAKVEDIFKRVRLGVRRESRGQQIPWESTSLEHDFYFVVPKVAKKSVIEENDPAFEQEATTWEKLRTSRDVDALEAYVRQYPSGRFSELAQFRLDTLLLIHGEKHVAVAPASNRNNPFTRGTSRADTAYAIGDRYVFNRLDRTTNASVQVVQNVTEITDTDVIYNKGRNTTDLLGNGIIFRGGTRERGRQFYISEYSVGKRWSTRFSGTTPEGKPLLIDVDLKVVTREPITVPAGTFNAYKVEGRGTNNYGSDLQYVYWIAPEQVRRPIVVETVFTARNGNVYQNERLELISYRQLREPGNALQAAQR